LDAGFDCINLDTAAFCAYYRIPSHAKFTINGEKKTAFDLRKGMSFEATIITGDTETVVARLTYLSLYSPCGVPFGSSIPIPGSAYPLLHLLALEYLISLADGRIYCALC
jgi:hypothetical protein